MLVLALDTSSPATSCALVELTFAEAGLAAAPTMQSLRMGSTALPSMHAATLAETLATSLILPPIKAGDLLPEALVALCEKAGRSLDDVKALAVGLGPGSFTGLRVGLASAKGLAYARRWPLAGASSLHALALGAARSLGLTSGVVVPALEARRGELFLSGLEIDEDGALRMHGEERVLMARDVPAFLAQLGDSHGPLHLLGPGAAKNLELLRASGVPESALQHASAQLHPSAAALAELCAPQLHTASFDPQALFAIAPLYLAQSEAEKALAEGRVGKLPA